MKISDFKELLIRSLDKDCDPVSASGKIENVGVDYKFSEGFSDRVLERIFSPLDNVVREMEFVRSLNLVFYRIALTGVAAIVLLLISIFVVQGSLSFNSVLGLGNSFDESVICLITGNLY
jgi:hypothetical protein